MPRTDRAQARRTPFDSPALYGVSSGVSNGTTETPDPADEFAIPRPPADDASKARAARMLAEAQADYRAAEQRAHDRLNRRQSPPTRYAIVTCWCPQHGGSAVSRAER